MIKCANGMICTKLRPFDLLQILSTSRSTWVSILGYGANMLEEPGRSKRR